MDNRIAKALTNLFERHRIIFWYDDKRELRADFEALELEDVEKLEINNNEFGLKYRILREQPKQKFLLYHEGRQPDDIDNWLLDVLLGHGNFRTDQVGLWLSELHLGPEFADMVREHSEFFKAAKRKASLKTLLGKGDSAGMIRLKMLAICACSDPRIDSSVEHLLAEIAEKQDGKCKLITRCHLDGFLFEQMNRHYGYQSKEPSIRDFVVELFKSCYAMNMGGEVKLGADTLVFLKRWKDSRQFEKSFETLSDECADVLGIKQDLEDRDFHDLVELDYFSLIDQKIIASLVRDIGARTISSGDVALLVRQRRQGHWYKKYRDLYEALDHAAQFFSELDGAKLDMESLSDGVQKYSRTWFRLDQLYRKVIYHVRVSSHPALMGELVEQIENLYSNNYLLKVNDRWQVFVDKSDKWDATPIPSQSLFFEQKVQPFLDRDKKVCVIISDALRYEVGNELLGLISREDRYTASLEPCLSMLPSYTQLGMAALLPHKELSLADNKTSTVIVDGHSSQGTANRIKILDRALPGKATALKADQLMALNRDECRELVRNHDILYIYHNLIDATGDKRESEERVFEAVDKTLEELIKLIKKLTGANASNMLLTSDHGFIYQNRPIDESDFASDGAEGDGILFKDRRFVLGINLDVTSSLKKFSSDQLGLVGNVEVLIPKSINRLRLKGSGSRFVHGGASLQEVVVPILSINKKRKSDISLVDVDILRGASETITSGQLAVVLYQAQPATEKVQSRTLRAGIYTQAGDLISDRHILPFDLTSDNPREREQQVRFVLSHDANEANNQEVMLKLEEKHSGTSHYKEYKSLRYMLRRSFTSDFDF